MPLEQGCRLQAGDVIEISLPGHQHWAVYVGDGNIVHLTGSIVGAGEDSLHGDYNVVQNSEVETEAKDCVYKVNNKLDGALMPRSTEDVVKSALQAVGEKKPYGLNCQQFSLELRYGPGNLGLVVRALAPIPGEMTLAAAKGVQLIGSAVSTSSEVAGSITAKGVDLAGQGVSAISGVLGAAAGKGLAAFGTALAAGAQVLAPIVAAKADSVSAGSGAMFLTAAEHVSPLGESLVAKSSNAEEATTQGLKDLGATLSAGSGSVGSAVASGLSWLGSTSSATASSIIGYLKSGSQLENPVNEKILSSTDEPDQS